MKWRSYSESCFVRLPNYVTILTARLSSVSVGIGNQCNHWNRHEIGCSNICRDSWSCVRVVIVTVIYFECRAYSLSRYGSSGYLRNADKWNTQDNCVRNCRRQQKFRGVSVICHSIRSLRAHCPCFKIENLGLSSVMQCLVRLIQTLNPLKNIVQIM